MKLTDSEIVVRLKEVESDLKAYAFKLTKDYDKSHDLFQDTYIKVWTNREKYKEDKGFRSWCHTIMYNMFISGIQQRARENTVSLSTLSESTLSHMEDNRDSDNSLHYSKTYGHVNSSSNNGESDITLDDIYDCINENLKGVHKTIVIKKISGETYKDISKQVNLSIQNCKVKYFHGIRKIRKELKEKFNISDEFDPKPNLTIINRAYHNKQATADATYRKRFD